MYKLKQIIIGWTFSLLFIDEVFGLNSFGKLSTFFPQKNWCPVVGITALEDRKAHYRVLEEKIFSWLSFINNSVMGIKRVEE